MPSNPGASRCFSLKGHFESTVGFVGPVIFVTTTWLCPCSLKETAANSKMNEHGCVPVKLFHTISTSQNILLIFFLNQLKVHKNVPWARFGLQAIDCQRIHSMASLNHRSELGHLGVRAFDLQRLPLASVASPGCCVFLFCLRLT